MSETDTLKKALSELLENETPRDSSSASFATSLILWKFNDKIIKVAAKYGITFDDETLESIGRK